MKPWQRVSPSNPCRICSKPDWCCLSADGAWALCRRVDTGAGIKKRDRAGAEYWLYRLDGLAPAQPPSREPPAQPGRERAEPAVLDHVYHTLLAALALQSTHRQALRQRGLPDVEILRRNYRTIPLHGRAALARRVVDRFGADVCATIPGFYIAKQDGRRYWSMAGAPGLLIPVRNIDGRIVALKVRADHPGEGPKYTYLSSTKHDGPSPGAQGHVPLHGGRGGDMVRLSEGELKSDVATVLSGILTVSIPGVALWRQALPVLQALER